MKILILIIILILFLVLPNFKSFAQDLSQLKEECATKEECEILLKKFEEKITQYETNIKKTEKEKRTLRNQISILRNRIAKLDTQIRQGNIRIRNLDVEIKDNETSIEDTSLKIKDSRKKLAALLRAINRDAQEPFVEVFLIGDTLSDFFNNLNNLETLNTENKRIFDELVKLKLSYEKQKQVAENKRREERNIVSERLLRKQERIEARKEQERLMRMTEAEHREYLRKKAAAEKSVAEIRARIVRLLDVPEGELLSFEQLLEVARWVETQTGIRPAFLLSIIAQESAFGRNVGGCHIINFETAEGVCVRLGGICTQIGKRVPMASPNSIRPFLRQVPHFLNITKELGHNPQNTPVSCVMLQNGSPFGFGGAMGPAQFIPRTWILIRDEVRAIIDRIPNPWKIHDSFLASGVYLKRHGGAQGGDRNELNAAMRYFSGSDWSPWEERMYGRPVITRANCFQVFIDQGTMTEDCRRRIEAFVNM
jgi:peptidoglycan hydrolase CwlO-like protein